MREPCSLPATRSACLGLVHIGNIPGPPSFGKTGPFTRVSIAVLGSKQRALEIIADAIHIRSQKISPSL